MQPPVVLYRWICRPLGKPSCVDLAPLRRGFFVRASPLRRCATTLRLGVESAGLPPSGGSWATEPGVFKALPQTGKPDSTKPRRWTPISHGGPTKSMNSTLRSVASPAIPPQERRFGERLAALWLIGLLQDVERRLGWRW